MRLGLAFAAALVLSACATTPKPPTTPAKPAAPEAPIFTLKAVSFAEMPGWAGADPVPALKAFKKSCGVLLRRADDQKLGRSAAYGGTVGEWRPVCTLAATISETGPAAKAFFETNFTPNQVVARADQMSKLTGYYEPVIQVSRTPTGPRTEPFIGRPADLVGIDLSDFDEQTELSETIAEDVAKNLPADIPPALREQVQTGVDARLERRFATPLWGRLTGDRRVVPYAKRSELPLNQNVLAYAHPADFYDTQVQGSARVRFDDGSEARMAYNSQNGWKWNSVYGCLRREGKVTGALNKANVKAWMDTQTPDAVRTALNCDPSYVFFQLDPLGDPQAGPKGAQGLPLTPFGSIAVDPAAHPYGAVLYVDSTGPDGAGGQAPRRNLVIAQDTGGAIRRGPLRGDFFYGTGDAAMAMAETQNAEVRFWTLLPKPPAAPVS
jgi:membrane-bound lytic murein transglycosylase A